MNSNFNENRKSKFRDIPKEIQFLLCFSKNTGQKDKRYNAIAVFKRKLN